MSNLTPVRKFDLTLHGYEQTISRSLLQDGIIVDALVDANAGIQQSKIAGLVAALAALGASITGEEVRALAAEAALDGRLDTLEGDDTTAGSVAFAVKAEETRALAAEAALSTEISEEVSRALAEEAVLDGRLDTLEGSDTTVGSVAYAVKGEETRALAAEAVLDGRLDTLEGDDTVVGSVAHAVKLEENARVAGDAATLSSAEAYADQKIADLVDSAPALLDTLNELAAALGDDPNFSVTVLNAVANEQTRAEAAEAALDGRLDTLEGDYTVVGSVAHSVKTEETRAMGVEAALQAEIDAEEVRALAAEVVLQGNIDAEEARALAAELVLQGEIDAEETRAMAAELVLQGEIDAEEARALAAEGVLQSNIDLKFNKAGGAIDTDGQITFDSSTNDSSTTIRDGYLDVHYISGDQDSRYDFGTDFRIDIEDSATPANTFLIVDNSGFQFESSGNNYNTYTQLNIVNDGVKLVEGSTGEAMMPTLDEHVVVKKYVDDEVSAAQTSLTNDLALEITNRTNADQVLQGNIDAEQAARIAGDAATLSSAQAYADQKIADLVDSAPAVLDTLNELAAALGDDPNFSTTILNTVSAEQTRAEAAETALDARLDTLEGGDTVVGSVAYAVKAEQTRALAAELVLTNDLATEVARAEAAEAGLDGRLDVLEAKTYREAFIYSAVGGESSLNKPVGAPAIPDSAATEVYIDGRKAFRGAAHQFTVANDGSSISFAALVAGQSVELRYFA